ncbi:hypothetical protein ACT7DA_07685 [Bacillus pacificus]
MFTNFTVEELGITPLFLSIVFTARNVKRWFQRKHARMEKSDHVILSGTKVRELLRNGEVPPSTFSRREVVEY